MLISMDMKSESDLKRFLANCSRHVVTSYQEEIQGPSHVWCAGRW